MATALLSHLDCQATSRILNLPAPSTPTEPARLQDLNDAIEGLAWKDDVVAASVANVVLATPGTTLDGVTLVTGNRILLLAQTAQSENGIYVWTGASTPLTRSLDSNTATELLSAIVNVNGGTANGGSTFRQTATNITLGTTAIVWTSFGAATPSASTATVGSIRIATTSEVNAGTVDNAAVTPATLSTYTGYTRKFAASIGDGVATSFAVTHSLATTDVHITVFLNSTGAEVLVDKVRTNPNVSTISFNTAPSTNAYRVVVTG